MERISVNVVSTWEHCSQIVTGFCMLEKWGGYELRINCSKDMKKENPDNIAIVIVEYKGKIIIYDLMDGYQNISEISKFLKKSDFYFKRSYSNEKNKMIQCQDQLYKMYPLGMNYMITCKDNPYVKENLRSILFRLRGDKPKSYFTCDKFECPVVYKQKNNMEISFFTRLWEGKEFYNINNTRIEIIRKLKSMYGKQFIGGIRDSSVARLIAPDLIVSKQYSERSRYLKRLKNTDICIGTTGLHDSTGWKTAEYVALGKAIICEPLKYSVPGNFFVGENYLEFSTAEACIDAVQRMFSNPDFVYQMKLNNLLYYYQYLKPDIMIKRTLDIVDAYQ